MDRYNRTRLLCRDDKGGLFETGATPETLRKLKASEESGDITILRMKPFVLGEFFTEEEMEWNKAA